MTGLARLDDHIVNRRDTWLNVNGCRIFVKIRGAGPPIYALHGGPGLDHTTLLSGLMELEQFYQVCYIDLRGHGISDRANPLTYTFPHLVEDLEEIRKQLGNERVTLLGHSMGGKLALLYALKLPRRVRSMILVSTSPTPPQYAKYFLGAPGRLWVKIQLLRWALWGFLKPAFSPHATEEQHYYAYWDRCWPFYARRRNPPLFLRELLLGAIKPPMDTLHPLNRAMAELNLTRVLDQIYTRTLCLCGQEDVLFVQDQPTFRRLPNVTCRLIPDAGHFPFVEQPELFIGEIREFLEESKG